MCVCVCFISLILSYFVILCIFPKTCKIRNLMISDQMNRNKSKWSDTNGSILIIMVIFYFIYLALEQSLISQGCSYLKKRIVGICMGE